MTWNRRDWLKLVAASALAGEVGASRALSNDRRSSARLTITGLKVTPIALPDPPLLAASGCHGPYFLRNVVELETDGGFTGVGEVPGGVSVTAALDQARPLVVGQNAFAYRRVAGPLLRLGPACYAGIEMACLDACGLAT